MPNRKRTVVRMADTWESGVAGKTLDEAFENLAQLDSILQQAKDAAAEAAGYADSIDPDNFASAEQGAKADAAATAVSYTITVPSAGWTSAAWYGEAPHTPANAR